MANGAAIGFWKTVRLLLAASRRRSGWRRVRQRELLTNRSGYRATDWGVLATIPSVGLMAFLHGAAAFAIIAAVDAGQHRETERQSRIVVDRWFLEEVRIAETPTGASQEDESRIEWDYREEASEIAHRSGGDQTDIERRLRAAVAASGSSNLIARADVEPGMPALPSSGRAGPMLGSILLLWWLAMVICQGEGLDLDPLRRRHPMWEWLLSHPVGAGAVFLAEMLSPLFANVSYWAAPIFAGILYGATYDALTGLAATFLIGVPVTVAAACFGKALEIGALLRLAPRSRGAVIGMLSWFGYTSMLAMFLGVAVIPQIFPIFARWIDTMGIGPWPLLGLFLGLGGDGGFSLLRGLLFCWAASALLIVAAVAFSARSMRNGLAGAFPSDALPRRPRRKAEFGREPLYRKEYLWFVRDRSAIVQVILIPVTAAAFQLFSFRFLREHALDSWNYLSGAAIFFGTYFLWVLGPQSLMSEGSALWIALTWPRGLESMLKAKAWLWSLTSSALVLLGLLVACWLFPLDAWKVALVAVAWFFFARSMAEKTVTLVTVVSESGEPTPIPRGRRWAAQLGMLTFAIGVCTEQWNLAIVGIVYSWITAAAMWENLRARLPYLYDPWSERLPEPPTLMHAMVSISIMIECAALLTGIVYGIGGEDSLGPAQGIGYAVCAVGVSLGMSYFLWDRDVSPARIWCWREEEPDPDVRESLVHRYLAADRHQLRWLFIGVGGGVLLGLLAHAYLTAVQLIPSIGEMVRVSEQQMRSIPGMDIALAIVAIGFAPFAEEYLFRGLVFRSLDRQWGGRKAVGAAAAFFAIYHPALSWLPVAMVGAANCVLFKRSKRLAPAILLHMSYNAVVVLWS